MRGARYYVHAKVIAVNSEEDEVAIVDANKIFEGMNKLLDGGQQSR